VADGVGEGVAVGDGADEGEDDRAAADALGVASAEVDPPRCADVLAGPHDAAARAMAAAGTIQITGLDRYRMTTSPRQPGCQAGPVSRPVASGHIQYQRTGPHPRAAGGRVFRAPGVMPCAGAGYLW
jgi:hypothetical protein